jgi:hypothetical protein
MKIANDPTRVSLGARVLGMGSAFTAVADDATAIFINPAGLARINTWEIASMSGKFINIYDYVQLAALVPTRIGTFGLGYGGSSIEFRVPSYEVIIIGDERRFVPTGEVVGKYANTAMLLSYAGRVDRLNLGASFKVLSQDLSATGLTGGTASGCELNVGVLYPVRNDLNFGLSVLNVLPASLGGKIKWSTGQQETFPAILKAGLAYRLPLPQRVTAIVDYDQYITRSDLPGFFRCGLEWFPVEYAALRCGLEQNLSANQSGATRVANDLTYGLGLLLNGFRFDYAYHNYSDLTANATNYFSLSFSPVKEPVIKEAIKVKTPDDGSVFNSETAVITGIIVDPAVKRVIIQGAAASIEGISFTAPVRLNLQLNSIPIEAYNKKGKVVQELTWQLVRLLSFPDVAQSYWARQPIEQLATLTIISGYADNTFRPEETITRAELCSLLMKAQGPSDIFGTKPGRPPAPKFWDVPDGYWAAEYIERAVAQGIMKGYSGGVFRPNADISRAEGIMAIVQWAALPLSLQVESPYSDVPGRHWVAGAIIPAKQAGLLDFIKDGNFIPEARLKRSEVAYILARTDQLKKMIKDKLGDGM